MYCAVFGVREDAGVQQFGCWAISNIALASDDIRIKIRDSGIVEVSHNQLPSSLYLPYIPPYISDDDCRCLRSLWRLTRET
jgi:hypothetical protein